MARAIVGVESMGVTGAGSSSACGRQSRPVASRASRKRVILGIRMAADISFALWTTAAGMAISIPLIVINSAAQNKINSLQESVDEGLGPLLEDLAAARQRDGAST